MLQRKLIVVILLCVHSLLEFPKCDGHFQQHLCEDEWHHFKGKCYYVFREEIYTYQEARTVCAGLGGMLVKINNDQEHLYLKGYTLLNRNLWIGATDLEHEGRWKWEDGTPVTYSHWHPGQPDNAGNNEHCAHLYKLWNANWNDAPCTTKMGFICEKDTLCKITDVGVESGAIPDSQMTANSYYSANNMPYRGRLNFHQDERFHAWSSRTNAVGQWLQIDLGRIRKVVKVATQGRGDMDQWVKSYKLRYIDDSIWKYVTDSTGNEKLFSGNNNRDTIVYHEFFSSAFIAQYVRFYPMTWHNHISMRVEVYACE